MPYKTAVMLTPPVYDVLVIESQVQSLGQLYCTVCGKRNTVILSKKKGQIFICIGMGRGH